MSDVPSDVKSSTSAHPEFNERADEYYLQHKKNIALTGETPEFFSEYKIVDLARVVRDRGIDAGNILDFGSGIGGSVPYFRKYFGHSKLTCVDISQRSIEIAQNRFPGEEKYFLADKNIPLATNSQDIAFSACVFHHIEPETQDCWLTELHRVTKPGGMLAIYEHNPLNPLTLHAVNTCPLDINARLIRASKMKKYVRASGWENIHVEYRVFFPSMLKLLRPLEQYLSWLAIGAQYFLHARKPL